MAISTAGITHACFKNHRQLTTLSAVCGPIRLWVEINVFDSLMRL